MKTIIKRTIHTSALSKWLEDPFTQLYMDALKEIKEKDNHRLVMQSGMSTEPYILERNLYRTMGRTEIINKATEYDQIKDSLLDKYVEWKEG